MKQVIQSYKTGAVTLRDVPVPTCPANCVLVRNEFSLVSLGTERATIELGKKSLLGKAKARPDLVKKVVQKAKKEGLKKTFKEAMGRLDTPTPLGYSAAGTVVETGAQVSAFAVGDRVACIGQGFASHAEYIVVPVNMVCTIPKDVESQSAAFGMLGTIAMHGIRKADLSLGSVVVVFGLGLLGLLTVQILKAYGCVVYAIDTQPTKVDLAKQLGADFATTDMHHLEQVVKDGTLDQGADAALLTLSTQSDQPVTDAINLLRFQGRMVIVGVADIHPDRNLLWEKEIELVVSKASGPGSLEPDYELRGIDIPLAYARWTQKRNLEEFMRLLAAGLVKVKPLISAEFPINEAEKVYQSLLNNQQQTIGVLFRYHKPSQPQLEREITLTAAYKTDTAVNASVIGAGIFAKALLLPELKKQRKFSLQTLVAASGSSAEHTARKFGFNRCATDLNVVFNDANTDVVFGLAPHDLHFKLLQLAVAEHKHLFLEKPLCIHEHELDELEKIFLKDSLPLIMVGHNRRYSPHSTKIKEWLAARQQPLVMSFRVNAGYVDKKHWVHSIEQGRSRIIGEMTHFLDLLQYLTGSMVTSVHAIRTVGNDATVVNNDNITVNLTFADGSIANLLYSGAGSKDTPREQLEIFFDGNTIRSIDYRESRYWGKKKKVFKTSGQEIGYQQELAVFVEALLSNDSSQLPALAQEIRTMRLAFAIERSLARDEVVTL